MIRALTRFGLIGLAGLISLHPLPALASGSPISTAPLGPTPNSVWAPRIVALGDGYLALWPEGDTGSVALHGTRLDAGGRVRDVPSLTLSSPQASILFAISTASDGSSAFALWTSYTQSGVQTRHLTRVDADGTTKSLSEAPAVPAVYLPAPSLAAGGGNLLVVLADDQNVLTATLLDRNGTLLRNRLPIAQTGGRVASIDTAYEGNGAFLVTWVDDDNRVRVVPVVASDLAAGTVAIVPFIRATAGGAVFAKIVSAGGHSMVFWPEYPVTGGPIELRDRPLSPSGSALNDAPVILGNFQSISSVIATSDGYRLLAFEYVNGLADIAVLQVAFDGALQSLSRMPFFTFATYFTTASGSDGRTVAVWMDSSYPHPEIVAAPMTSDSFAGPGGIISHGLPRQSVRKLLAWRGSVAALWTESSAYDRVVVGRFTPNGKPMDGPGLRIHDSIANQRNSAMATDGDALFVAWTEGVSTNHRLYGAVVPFSGFGASPVTRELASDAGDGDVAVVWNGSSYTIVYPRAGQLVARRVDALGYDIDPLPFVLTPPRDPMFFADANPRLSWNGSEYLLVWQRQSYYAIPLPILPPSFLVNQLFAQRFSASLSPTGAEIPLATRTGNADASGPDLALSGGMWLASWVDTLEYATHTVFARIDANGTRIDPLYGRPIPTLNSRPFLAPITNGWLLAAGDYGISTTRIGLDGSISQPFPYPAQAAFTIEAFALAPLPVYTFKRDSDPLAYIDTFPQHGRAASH